MQPALGNSEVAPLIDFMSVLLQTRWVPWFLMVLESSQAHSPSLPILAVIRHCITTWIDLESVVLSEVSKTEKDKCHMISLICHIKKSKKKWYKWPYLQNRNRFTDLENELTVTQGWRLRGREFGMDRYTLLYLKWITNKDLHMKLLNVMWQPGWEGSLGENGYVHMYGRIPFLFTWSYHNIVN